MRIDRLRAANLRCHEQVELAPNAGVTAIVGPNGSGKTSLLEAAHLAMHGVGLRPTSDNRMIREGSPSLGVLLDGTTGDVAARVRIELRPGARTAQLNGEQVDGRTLRSAWATVTFIPDVMDLIKQGPAVRRLAMDRAIEAAWPRFEEHGRTYRHAMEQRNAVLRRIRRREGSEDELDPWDAQMANSGALIVEARERLIERCQSLFMERVEALGSPLPGTLSYVPAGPASSTDLLSALAARRREDLDRQTTGVGPHLDDLAVRLAGRDARRSASQGEQRTLVLAFLLAQAALVLETRGEQPILLLDDVLSELDRDRRRRLVQLAREHGQVLLTATGADGVDALADAIHELAPTQ